MLRLLSKRVREIEHAHSKPQRARRKKRKQLLAERLRPYKESSSVPQSGFMQQIMFLHVPSLTNFITPPCEPKHDETRSEEDCHLVSAALFATRGPAAVLDAVLVVRQPRPCPGNTTQQSTNQEFHNMHRTRHHSSAPSKQLHYTAMICDLCFEQLECACHAHCTSVAFLSMT